MTELKEKIKDFVGHFYFKWIFRKLKPAYKEPQDGGFLLLPPSDLDGSFGDELMVGSFVYNFAGKSAVTIFTDHLILRNDFLGQWPQVKYKSGFHVRNYGRWVKILGKVSAVFIVGADALDGSYTSRHSMRFLRLAQMAHKMGKPVYFSGFSVSRNLTDVAKNALAGAARFSLLKARDTDSYRRLATFVPKERLLQVSDMAFLCPYDDKVEETVGFQAFKKWAETQILENRKIAAFCPNSIQAERLGWEKYLAGQQMLLDSFSSDTDVSVLYLYHDVRALYDDKSDRDISKALFDAHTQKDSAYVYFPGNIENGIALKSYLTYASFTVTGRMHFGISGMEAGKPMFGICYADKFEGMLRLFDIDPGHSLIDYTEMEKGVQVVSVFLDDLDSQCHKIKENMEKVKQLSLLNGEDIT